MKMIDVINRLEKAVDRQETVLNLAHLGLSDWAEINFKWVEMPFVTALNVSNNNLSNLMPLSFFPNLTQLNIDANRFTTLKGIEKAVSLTALSAYKNKIRHIKAVEKLVNLEFLCLSENNIKDITPLRQLSVLKHLDIWGNKISDISALCVLSHLEVLAVQYNALFEIPPAIAQLKHLKELYLGENCLDIDEYEVLLPQLLPQTDIRFYEDLPL